MTGEFEGAFAALVSILSRTPCVLAAATVFDEAQMVEMVPCAGADTVHKDHKYTFRQQNTNTTEFTYIGEVAVNDLKAEKVAMIYIQNDSGIIARDTVTATVERLGKEVVIAEGVMPDQISDYSAVLTKIRAADPDVIDGYRLAYIDESPVNWCPGLGTVLANEEVTADGKSERGNFPVFRKNLSQWMMRITAYSDRLIDDLELLDWPEKVKSMQRNWIGRSRGAEVDFDASGHTIRVFTTRPDTLFGASYMVLAPEHELVDALVADSFPAGTDERWTYGAATPAEAVEAYRRAIAAKSDVERQENKDKTGVFLGTYATNPVNGAQIPVFIADYVLTGYGTGAIMAVPAHDERDFQFALKFGLPILPVIKRTDGLSKSLVFPGSVKDLSAVEGKLGELGITWERKPVGALGDGLFVTLHGEAQTDAYIALLQAQILPGNWNEVVGTRFAFVFDDGAREFDSLEAGEAILARCKAIWPPVRDNRTLMEMLYHLEFYRDALFHADYGDMINSGAFTGTPGESAKRQVTAWLKQQGVGDLAVRYRLHDWLISRQRYWGAPIPMIYCDHCGIVPVPYEDLPVLLPEDAEFLPTGESPLVYHEGFLNTTCPKCGGPAKRETDTMDTFMCSSWYHYAYVSPYYQGDVPFDPEKGRYWLPVDQYTGGIEHATMHLMYTRFFTKAMRDIGLVDFDEPMKRLFNQGMILGEDSEKMSKSRGNVVNPDDLVATLGADATRAYLMFIGPWDEGGPWNSLGIEGISRFLNRVWEVVTGPIPEPKGQATDKDVAALRRITHQTIRRVTDDIEHFQFNTMLAALMEYNNYIVKAKNTPVAHTPAWDEAVRSLVLLVAPTCPHIAEELWEFIGGGYSVHQQPWPAWSEELAKEEAITLIVQINGKVRDRLTVPAGLPDDELKKLALESEGAKRYTEGLTVVNAIVAGGRLVNIVAR